MSRRKSEQKQLDHTDDDTILYGKRKTAPNNKPIQPKRRKVQTIEHSSEPEQAMELTKECIENFLLSLTEKKLNEKLSDFCKELPRFNALIMHLKETPRESRISSKFFGTHDISAIKAEILERKNNLLLDNRSESLEQMPFFCMMLIYKFLDGTRIYATLRTFLCKHRITPGPIDQNVTISDIEWANAIFIGLKESIALLVYVQHSETVKRKDFIFKILEDYFPKNKHIQSKVSEIKTWVYGIKSNKKELVFTMSPAMLNSVAPNPEDHEEIVITGYRLGGLISPPRRERAPIQSIIDHEPYPSTIRRDTDINAEINYLSQRRIVLQPYSEEDQTSNGLTMQEPSFAAISRYRWNSERAQKNCSGKFPARAPNLEDETPLPRYSAYPSHRFFPQVSPQTRWIPPQDPTIFYK